MNDTDLKNTLLNSDTTDVMQHQEFIQDAKYTAKLIQQQIAKGTKRVYTSDWAIFTGWCHARRIDPITANGDVIAILLGSQFKREFHPSTLNRRLAAIKFNFTCLGIESPNDKAIVRATLKGIRRDENVPPTREKKATTSDLVIKMLQHIPEDTLYGIRDRAILLLGFAGGFRHSELAALDIED